MYMDYIISLSIVFLIVGLGYAISKIVSRIFIKIRQRKESFHSLDDSYSSYMIIEKIIVILSIIFALIFLGVNTTDQIIYYFLSITPSLVIMLLLFILGISIINIILWFLKKIMIYFRVEDYFSSESQPIIIPIFLTAIKVILFLTLAYIIFNFVDYPILKEISSYILYPTIVTFFIIIIIGLINPVRDLFSRFYLTNLVNFRKGSLIKVDNKEYYIKKITTLSTELEDISGSIIIFPHRILASKPVEFRKPIKDIDTLEFLKDKFVPQLKSHCGPATAQMALSIFGYDKDQVELGKLMGVVVRKDKSDKIAGTHPLNIIKAIEKITEREVIGSWIGFDKIYDLKKEISVWLNQGGLVIIDYKKKYLFPNAQYAHYSLVVGVRGDELLVVDPSGKSGGVYFADYRDILLGMNTYSELIKGKRGYIIIAPKGTAAYQRIKDNILYYDVSMYNKVTKNLNLHLTKLSNLSSITEILPSFMKNHLNKVNKNQISRVWRPNIEDDSDKNKIN
jgi:hypothetical protein